MEQNVLKQMVVIYHSNCYDGFLAAYAAWLRLDDKADYLPMGYDDHVNLAKFQDRDVIMVDFSMPYEQTCLLANNARSVVIIDHHKTAEAALSNRMMPANVTVKFDMSKAGCVMAAEHFLGGVPWYFNYVGDRDIWQFQYAETKEFCAGFFAEYPLDTLSFEKLHSALAPVGLDVMTEREHLDLAGLCAKGKTLLDYRNSLMRGWLKNVRVLPFEWDGGKCQIGVLHNVPIEFISEMGHMMMDKFDDIQCATLISTRHFDKAGHPVVSVSWRSIDGRQDVSAIAKSFGGGGHRNAAGCTMSFADAFDLNLFS